MNKIKKRRARVDITLSTKKNKGKPETQKRLYPNLIDGKASRPSHQISKYLIFPILDL
jgi:hypothetical protein